MKRVPRFVTVTILFVCATLLARSAVAQFTQQGSKLVGTGAVGASRQGVSSAISGDGHTAIVGGNADNGNAGAAWVYTESGGTWAQQGSKLVGTGATGVSFRGFSAALSADGNTALVGGYSDNANTGAAWVWTRDQNGAWTQQGSKLIGTGAVGTATLGRSAALSADGNTAIIGGNSDNSAAGAAWVFTRDINGNWSQQGNKLVGSGASGAANQGISVAISADGNTAIVGGNVDSVFNGAAWIWTRDNNGLWTQQGNKLVGTLNEGAAEQGVSVAISDDGNTAMVGGWQDDHSTGAAWVFTRSGGVWTQQGAKLVGTGVVSLSRQGWSVALSGDGSTALIGGFDDNNGVGATWVWKRASGTWTQQGTKLIGTGATGNAQQGRSLALSSDGKKGIVGGYSDNSNLGAAWIFSEPSGSAIPTNVTAAAVSTTEVDVAWTAAPGADSYQIDRETAGAGFSQIGTSVTNSFADLTASAASAYRYRVRAVYGVTTSGNSNADLATTVLHIDSPLASGVIVKAAHLSDLRTAVDAVRLLAGLPAATFTDAATAGTPIRAVHITELRTALDAALSLFGLSTGGYADGSLGGIAIKAVHVQELRDRVY